LDCTGIGKSTGWHAHQLLIRLEVNTPTFVILWWKIVENPVTYCRFLRALCAKLSCNMICAIGFQNQMASDSRLSGLHGSLSESIVPNREVQENDVETVLPHSNLSTRPWGKQPMGASKPGGGRNGTKGTKGTEGTGTDCCNSASWQIFIWSNCI